MYKMMIRPFYNNVLYTIATIYLLSIIIACSPSKKTNKAEPAVTLYDADRGVAICQEARKIYKANSNDVRIALTKLNEGIAIIENALSKFRNSNNELRPQYAGYDLKLGEFYQARKLFKEQAFIQENTKERKK